MGRKAAGAVIFCLGFSSWIGLAAAQEPPAPQGPEAYWKLDEPNLTAGVSSAVGTVPLGTYHGGVTVSNLVPPVTYKNDHSLSFNGTDAGVDIGQFGAAFTKMSVSAWVYLVTGAPGGRQTIVSYKEGNNGGFVLCLNDGGVEWPRIYVHQGGWVAKDDPATLTTTAWVHLAATYDNTNLRLYRDGVEVAAGLVAGPMTNPSGMTGIGGRSSMNMYWYKGLIDDVRIYSRALDPEDVKILAAGCPVPTGLTATPTTGPVTLNWSAPPGTQPLAGYTYNVKRGDYPGLYNHPVATGLAATTIVDNSVTVGNTYYYTVTAVSAAESGNCVEAVAYPPITATPNTGLFTSENLTSTSFDIKFNLAVPAGETVTLTITSSDTSEGTVSDGTTSGGQIFHDVVGPVTLPFSLPITVTGVNDLIADGPQNYTVIVTTSSTNTAGSFHNLTIPPINVTNNDAGETAGITFNKTVGLLTTESGGTDTFSVVLNSQPANVVTLTLVNSNPAEVSLSQSVFSFNSSNWNTGFVVTLTGLDDMVLDFTQPFTITGTLVPTDPVADSAYVGMPVPVLSGVNLDDEAIPPAKSAWGGGGCGLLGGEIGLPLLLLGLWRRRRSR